MRHYYTINRGRTIVASAFVHGSGDVREVSSVDVYKEYRGQGYGSALLRTICAAADAEEITLTLMVGPSLDSPLQAAELYAWYGRHGFELRGFDMWRYPRTPFDLSNWPTIGWWTYR